MIHSIGRSLSLRSVAFLAFATMLSACGSAATPSAPAPPPACSGTTITIGRFPNGSPASPAQGQVWTSYFQSAVLSAQSSVWIVDLAFSPAGCVTTWTAVSADRAAVQLSPASGTGSAQVELFMPANSGTQRSTTVTIAGQTALITQAGGFPR